VQEGQNGTLADVDDPASLADAVGRALQPQVLPILSAGTTPTAAAHDWPAICQQYLSLYEQRRPSEA
jgi:glycosyltransferase involved in cell wall biosynthesis